MGFNFRWAPEFDHSWIPIDSATHDALVAKLVYSTWSAPPRARGLQIRVVECRPRVSKQCPGEEGSFVCEPLAFVGGWEMVDNNYLHKLCAMLWLLSRSVGRVSGDVCVFVHTIHHPPQFDREEERNWRGRFVVFHPSRVRFCDFVVVWPNKTQHRERSCDRMLVARFRIYILIFTPAELFLPQHSPESPLPAALNSPSRGSPKL